MKQKKNLLVLATDYPRPDGYVACYFIHNRNKYYFENNFNVVTINFSAKVSYEIDNIKVLCLEDYLNNYNSVEFDFLISHAPNLRDHYRFIKKHHTKFPKILFYFHGHEVLKHRDSYPKAYEYLKKSSAVKNSVTAVYDELKLFLWAKKYLALKHKSEFIFVSEWMKEMFYKNTGIKDSIVKEKSHVIYNCVGDTFIKNNYDIQHKKEFDFITIRNILDHSKYSIDIVNKIAMNNPTYKFCIVGRGDYFKYNKKAENITLIESHLNHTQIIEMLNKSNVALMPTRADAQGVMMCEMLTFGIPLVTSDIKVCEEIFKDVNNVSLINNNDENIILDLENLKLSSLDLKLEKFNVENTIFKEIDLMNRLG